MSLYGPMMTMRAEVRRNNAAKDAHGHPGKPEWTLIRDSVPCYVWSTVRQRTVDRAQAEVEEISAIFRKDADVRAFDRIEQIKDRRGQVIMAGPFEVITATEKALSSSVQYTAVKLRRVA